MFLRHRQRTVSNGKALLDKDLPTVLVQLPVLNESSVVHRLLMAASKLDYPSEKLIIQLLDDSNDDTTKIAAATIKEIRKHTSVNIQHVTRPNRVGYKAGSLNYGMDLADGELIAIFDADFLPQPDFLRKVIQHFEEPNVGIVQIRWSHTNQSHSILTKMMALALDNHFVVEHCGRQALGAFSNFNGTAGVLRRQAILEAGGWHSDCLTEDLDLSYRVQLAGWSFKYVAEIATPSEIPIFLADIHSQQFRWTKGGTQTAVKNLGPLWKSNTRFVTKILGSFHLLGPVVYIVSLCLGLSCLAIRFLGYQSDPQFIREISWFLISANIATTIMYLISRWHLYPSEGIWVLKEILSIQLFMLFFVGHNARNSIAALEGLLGKKSAFIRTPKYGQMPDKLRFFSHQNLREKLASVANYWPEATLAILFGWAAFLHGMTSDATKGVMFGMTFYFFIGNAITLLYAIFE